jgi:hypothetical protein
LEDSEDCRSVGGHGNQHVRLRSAQIDCIETICPALAALCRCEPWQASDSDCRFDVPARDFKTQLQASRDFKSFDFKASLEVREFRKHLCIENL